MNSNAPGPSTPSRKGKSIEPFLDARTDLFLYFAEQLGERDWSQKNVLDFGGNIGGLLRDRNSTIQESRYWCIDIVAEAIEQGRRDYPQAHWVFYDLYNFRFNPYGIVGVEFPDPGQRFDIIAAYSVFTSNFEADLVRLVSRLEQMLTPGGQLAFTFMDPDETLRWRLDRILESGVDIDVQALASRARGSRWCAVLNERELYIDTDELPSYPPELQKSCYVFHSVDYIRGLFPHATIAPPPYETGQHCCIIRRPPLTQERSSDE